MLVSSFKPRQSGSGKLNAARIKLQYLCSIYSNSHNNFFYKLKKSTNSILTFRALVNERNKDLHSHKYKYKHND